MIISMDVICILYVILEVIDIIFVEDSYGFIGGVLLGEVVVDIVF